MDQPSDDTKTISFPTPSRQHIFIRRGFMCILYPLALFLVVYLGYGTLARLVTLYTIPIDAPPLYYDLPQLQTVHQRQEEKRVSALLSAMRSRPDNDEYFRQQWRKQRTPDDRRLFFGYYAALLVANQRAQREIRIGTPSPKPANSKLAVSPGAPPPGWRSSWTINVPLPIRDNAFEQAMQLGEQLDPDNALYHLKLAEYYLDMGVLSPRDYGFTSHDQTAKDYLLDQQMADRGVAEFRMALHKPTLTYFHTAMCEKRLALLPRAKQAYDYCQRIGIFYNEQLLETRSQRKIANKISAYARILAAQGRKDDAMQLCELWKPYTILIAHGEYRMRRVEQYAYSMATNAANLYDDLGMHREAEKARRAAQSILPRPQKPQRIDADPFEAEDFYKQYGPYISAFIAPSDGGSYCTAAELAPMRYHERAVLELLTVSLILMLLAVVLICSFGKTVIVKLVTRRAANTTAFLLPSRREALRIIGFGIFLPLIVYYLYSRMPIIGGWQHGLLYPYMPLRRMIELGIVGVAVLTVPPILTWRLFHQKLAVLSIPIPTTRQRIEHKLFSLLVWGLWLAAIYGGIWFIGNAIENSYLVFLNLSLLALIGLVALIKLTCKLIAITKPYRSYYGTLTRSITPIYAMVILLLSVVVMPYLLYSEIKWLARDRILLVHDSPVPLLIQRVQIAERNHFLKVMADIDKR